MAGLETNLVLEINTNDVLCGRGVPVIVNLGNVRFRHLVRARKQEYVSNWRPNIKHCIANEILGQVHSHQGRFLRAVTSTKLKERFGIDANVRAWKEISREDAIEKIKQALRAKRGANHSTTTSLSTLSTVPVTAPPTPMTSENQRTSGFAVRTSGNVGVVDDTTVGSFVPASSRLDRAHLLPQTTRENRAAGAGRTSHPFMQQQHQRPSPQKEAGTEVVPPGSSSRYDGLIVPRHNRPLDVHVEATRPSLSVIVGRGDADSPIRWPEDEATMPLRLETRGAKATASTVLCHKTALAPFSQVPVPRRHCDGNVTMSWMDSGDNGSPGGSEASLCTQRSARLDLSACSNNHNQAKLFASFAPRSPATSNARHDVTFVAQSPPSQTQASLTEPSPTNGQVWAIGVPLPLPPPLSPNSIVHHANVNAIATSEPQVRLADTVLNQIRWTRNNRPSAASSNLPRLPSSSCSTNTILAAASFYVPTSTTTLGTSTLGTMAAAVGVSTNNRTSDDERLLLKCFAQCVQAVDRLSNDEVHELFARHTAVQLEEQCPPPSAAPAAVAAEVASVQLRPRAISPNMKGFLASSLSTATPPQLPLGLFHERNGTPTDTPLSLRVRLPSTTIPTRGQSRYGAFVGGVSGVASSALTTSSSRHHHASSQLDVLAEVAAMATIGTARTNSTR